MAYLRNTAFGQDDIGNGLGVDTNDDGVVDGLLGLWTSAENPPPGTFSQHFFVIFFSNAFTYVILKYSNSQYF